MPTIPTEHWYADCADTMIREDRSMFYYVCERGLGLTQRECENVVRTKAFQEIYRTRRNLYYRELANDPTLTKSAAKGHLMFVITKLIETGAYDKAGTQIMNLAKLEGWTSDQASVNVFADLSQKDLDALKKKFGAAAVAHIPKES